MSSDDLEPGDIVALRSGGPDMTVMEIYQDGTVRCFWMNDEGETDHDVFAVACLEKSE